MVTFIVLPTRDSGNITLAVIVDARSVENVKLAKLIVEPDRVDAIMDCDWMAPP